MTENFQGPYPTPYPPQSPGPVPPWPQPPMAWVEEAESEVNIMDYVRLIWARKWIVMGVTVVVDSAWDGVGSHPEEDVPRRIPRSPSIRRLSSPRISSIWP